MALIALAIAFSLPFILVKTFPHKNKTFIDNIPLTLPAIPEQEEAYDDSEASSESEPADESDSTGSTGSSDASDSSGSNEPAESNVANGSNSPSAPEKKPRPTETATKPASIPANTNGWKIIKTQTRDSMARIFNRVGLNAKILNTIMQEISHASAFKRLQINQELRFLIQNGSLEKMIVPYGSTQLLTIYRQGSHYKSSLKERDMDSKQNFLSATVVGSLYGTAKKLGIPSKLIQQMTEIFTWDINFAKDVKSGDQFTIMYKAFYIDNKLVSVGDITAVTYKNRGQSFSAVRYTNRNGHSEYFTPQGQSLKKAFARYPLRFSHIGSPFSLSRYHPILHYARAHKGVDLAARIGTPIQATGDGRIEIIGSQNGYGNMIKIKHNSSFSSIYGHMLKFQKGLSKGSYVRRGQVIGYVGQTGLASGPHCHYEVHVNGLAKNPATVSLPRGAAVGSREMARFKGNTNTLLAQLKQFEEKRRIG